jgi:hypothetical protein
MAEQRTTTSRPCRGFISDEVAAHARAAREEMRKSVEALLPPGFAEHRRAARREMLLAARSVIDAALEGLEAREGE